MRTKYLIIGAGPTGLGAGWRLRQLGQEDFVILEAADYIGGLSASFVDSVGFTWDVGGHVLFSHYEYFDDLLDELLAGESLDHQRISRVRVAGGWVPYPFQNNIRHLPPDLCWECVRALLPENRARLHPRNFLEWCRTVFGEGISRIFMEPYNFKVWATPLTEMDFAWIGERVSVAGLERILKNVVLGRDDVAWGPNNTFRFPLRGGTGEIFRRLAGRMFGHIQTGEKVVRVNPEAKIARTGSGAEFTYEHLLTTMPLDLFASKVLETATPAVRDSATRLRHNSVHVTGVGLKAQKNDPTCWIYFPEDDCPFYRVTNFHNYSPNNAPAPGMSAFMCETSSSPDKPVEAASLAKQAVRGLVNTSLMTAAELDAVASTWEMSVEYGYPVPTIGRDKALAVIQPYLERRSIASRGRFGGFKYEVGNMDHSLMQGVEWADRVVAGTPETTYRVEGEK